MADAAEPLSISGATLIPANARLDEPISNRLRPKNFNTIFCSSEVAAPAVPLRLFLAARSQNQQAARKQRYRRYCRGPIDFRRNSLSCECKARGRDH
jgi:hypothetical protein